MRWLWMSIHFMLFSKYFLFITGPARARSTRFITLWFMEYIFILFSLEIMSYVYRKKINNIFSSFFLLFLWFYLVKNCIYLLNFISLFFWYLYLIFSFCRLTPNFETQCQNLGMKFFLITLATWQHIIIFIFHYLHIFPYIIIIFAHISLCEYKLIERVPFLIFLYALSYLNI